MGKIGCKSLKQKNSTTAATTKKIISFVYSIDRQSTLQHIHAFFCFVFALFAARNFANAATTKINQNPLLFALTLFANGLIFCYVYKQIKTIIDMFICIRRPHAYYVHIFCCCYKWTFVFSFRYSVQN